MPLTLSHAAAVMPIRQAAARQGLPFLGLVLGSFSPDFAYYVGRFDIATAAHSTLGSLLICVPICTLLASILCRWHVQLASPLPQPHRRAVQALRVPELNSVRGLFALAAAIFIGALTHVAWDSFTHASGEAVKALPVLRLELGQIRGRTIYLYGVLQHLSSVAGLLAVVLGYRGWIRRKQFPVGERERLRWALLWTSALAAMAFGVAFTFARGGASFSAMFVQSIFAATAGFAIAYAALVIYWMHRDRF
ncbi:DUF4184 family protein [Ramlibacter albus]|uniref:DUF4184 family protein n=1 Tax=Ramlibacter albus TaxID=2079448 RepID=A0A923MDX4_9BURK|nr:DUF4184 family protein [Ramlibacter albus]MBC5767683.1 DUF4184 family protein [Ramlibacter albus]